MLWVYKNLELFIDFDFLIKTSTATTSKSLFAFIQWEREKKKFMPYLLHKGAIYTNHIINKSLKKKDFDKNQIHTIFNFI